MSSKKQKEPKWLVSVYDDAESCAKAYADAGNYALEYEQVGNKLITRDFLDGLLEHVDGKIVDQPYVLSIPELIDDRCIGLRADYKRAVIGECLIHLINTQRIGINQEK